MSDDCLFCKIVRGDIPATKLHEDEDIVAFEDINPQAPSHVLVIPRKHVPTMNDLQKEDDAVVGRLTRVAAQLMQARGHTSWRAVVNCNEEAGQTVFHLHLHALGGRALQWPPG